MGLGSLLSAIGLAALKAEIRAAGQRIAVAVISGLLLLTAVCLAIAGLAVWLAGEIGTVKALFAIAGGFLVLALIVQVVARLASGRQRYRPPPPRPVPPGPAAAEAPPADATIPPGSEIGAVAIVALVGFLLARQMSGVGRQ
jgi:hypothetical protein